MKKIKRDKSITIDLSKYPVEDVFKFTYTIWTFDEDERKQNEENRIRELRKFVRMKKLLRLNSNKELVKNTKQLVKSTSPKNRE